MRTAQSIRERTGDAITLVDRYLYRRIEGDMTSLDSDVDQALIDAQQQLEDYLNRQLEYGTYSEVIHIHPDGRGYPTATPLQSVSSPASVIIRDDSIMGLIPSLNPEFDIVYEPYQYGNAILGTDSTQAVAPVTYMGGYSIDGVAAPQLPLKLRQAICDLAKVMLTMYSPATANVLGATVGDVSVRYAEAPDRSGAVEAILLEVRGFRRREIGY